MNGRHCSNLEHLSVLADALRVRVECEKAWGFWVGRCEKTEGLYALQLHTLRALCDTLDSALALGAFIEKCRETLQQCHPLSEPIWADESDIKQLIASCHLALARHKKRLVTEELRNIESPLAAVVANSDAHPVVSELVEAIRNRDVDAYAHATSKIQDLEKERHRLQKVDEYISKIQCVVPKLTKELERTCNDTFWEKRIKEINNTWHWAQARFWVEEYIRKEDAPSLAKRTKQIEDEINAIIGKLASLHAWSFCFSRLGETERRHMEAWQQSMRRIGKGTGKHAPHHRREAQQHLNECREAVPAWVMPLHRVWDTVSPSPGMFDVIIVDEASQCGFEALPLFYLGKKILIVGDDKQISPEVGFINKNAVFQLMEQFLYDFAYKDSFHRDASLFDHGKLRHGTRRITLREHFRCMPEIIRFSNDLCYSDQPLIPLRQYGSNRLTPLEHVFVEGGYRQGTNARMVNRPEAEALVEKIVELSKDERYEKKTMGVIVLQGEAQARLIEGQLLERLGAEEIEERRLVCGNPYSFQGDERHVMFLSMVVAPDENGNFREGPTSEQRFNVAASRAKDQMWLFHSIRVNDLSNSYLRKRLLQFFENTKPQEIAGIERDELERRAVQDNRVVVKQPKPFDSWFEVDVALQLARKGFEVLPQYECAGKRIDLVVQDGPRLLAVECDGDEWHGADRYEEDMQRQRQLERSGWEFFRVREAAFYSNTDEAMEDLWRVLEERGIKPFSRSETLGLQTPEQSGETVGDNEGKNSIQNGETVPEEDSASPNESSGSVLDQNFQNEQILFEPEYNLFTQKQVEAEDSIAQGGKKEIWPDPRNDYQHNIAERLIGIVQEHGPMLVEYANKIYLSKVGLKKLGKSLREIFQDALTGALRTARIENIPTHFNYGMIVKTPGQEDAAVRRIADRDFYLIPPNEIQQLAVKLNKATVFENNEALHRAILDYYAVGRLTRKAESHLLAILEDNG